MKQNGIFFQLCFLFSFIVLHSYDYDLVVLGGGAAGTKAAVLSHDLGKKVLIIEKSEKIGGGRLWHGDIPFKTLYSFSNKIVTVDELEKEGLVSESVIHIGQGQVLGRVSSICNQVYHLICEKHFSQRNIHIIFGSPCFIDAHTVVVNNKEITSKNFLIATGSRSYIPNIPGIEEVQYLHRENFFDLKLVPHFPKSIIIIGGGPLGIELAKVLNQCRVKVTLLVRHSVLLPSYDYEVIDHFLEQLLKRGVNVVCDVEAKKIEKRQNLFSIEVQNRAGKKKIFEAERLFVACGSIPNTEELGLNRVGVAISEDGTNDILRKGIAKNAIIVNDEMRTTVPNIYACGDVTGVNLLSRVAYYQAQLAVQNMFCSKEKRLVSEYNNVPQVLFAHPEELASVGLSEQKALQLYGKNILIYKYKYESLERAQMEKHTNGIAKFICDKKGIVLGIHIFGAYAGKLIDLVRIGDDLTTFAKEGKLSISTSPSYRELIKEVSYWCKNEVQTLKDQETIKEEPGWVEFLFTPSLWGKKNAS